MKIWIENGLQEVESWNILIIEENYHMVLMNYEGDWPSSMNGGGMSHVPPSSGRDPLELFSTPMLPHRLPMARVNPGGRLAIRGWLISDGLATVYSY
jgi:hypothetical protein